MYFILSALQGDACGLGQSGNRLCRRWKSVAIHGGYMDDGRADICSGGFGDHGVWSHCSLSGRIISHKNTLYVHVLALSYREWYFRWAYPVHSRFGRGSRSEEHTSELQSLMRISYAVFCLKNKPHNSK